MLMENIAMKAVMTILHSYVVMTPMEAVMTILHSYVVMTPMENITMEAVMTIPALLLRKPHAGSRSTEHASHLQERLDL